MKAHHSETSVWNRCMKGGYYLCQRCHLSVRWITQKNIDGFKAWVKEEPITFWHIKI